MSAATAPHPIEFQGLVKRFGHRTVIDELSFAVPQGAIVGLLGPNGAGKSTAMRVLLGLQRPTSGRTLVLGEAPGTRGFRAAIRKVGSIIEAPPLYKNASALQNLEIRVRAYGLTTRDADVRDILNQVGLAQRADDAVKDFSLGMRQRMGIALALVGDPSIVVLDEPTNGLDPEGTVEVRTLVRSLPDRGATTLLCTHRLAEVEATCDYVVVLDKGRLRAQGTLEEITAAAGGHGHRVEVAAGQVPDAAEVLRHLEVGAVSVDDGALRTERTLPDPAVITRALAERDIYVRGLSSDRASLEDAFLQLVGKAARGQEAGS